MKKYLIVVCALFMFGCSVGEDRSSILPEGWKAYYAAGAYSYVAPIQLPDGTKCVLVHSAHGKAISCNWK